ncbi:hypothetical protein CLIB1423_11S04720 [[Candida] railenensis]|uniref:C2H2-type domain-containing protein n=1 Tax=[Candida] railenensis TaxID=45579 RepID=A0A9P0QS90_9ASCO|nr:hypothetical protein CLIB1423_11S04720 [[Candida] railenensis]
MENNSGDPQNLNSELGMFFNQEFLTKDRDNSLQLVDIAENTLGEDSSSNIQWQFGGENNNAQPQQNINEDMMFSETYEDPFLSSNATDVAVNGVGRMGSGSAHTGVNEIDESPPFTIESDMFFDPMTIDDDQNSKKTPQSVFVDYNTPSSNQFDQHSISSSSYQHQQRQNAQSQSQTQLQGQAQGQIPASASYQQQLLSHVPVYHRGSIDSNSQQLPVNGNMPGLNFNNGSGFHELSPLTTVNSHTPSVSSVHSQQLSFFSAHQYLTRNSIDQSHPPSTNHHRASFDVYSKSRVSIDSQQSYNNFSMNNGVNTNNNSNNNNNANNINMNGSNSGANKKNSNTTSFFGSSGNNNSKRDRTAAPGRYTSFSFTNYIPFMSDKNSAHQRLDSGPTSPSSNSPPFAQQSEQYQQSSQQQQQQYQQQQQESEQRQQLQQEFQNPPPQASRHLIRSIFKNKNPTLFPSNEQGIDNNVSNNGQNVDGGEEELNYDGMEGLLSTLGNTGTGSGVGDFSENYMAQSQGQGIGLGPGFDANSSNGYQGTDLDDKKPKKIKRSLFTRFKSSNPEENNSLIKEENVALDSMEEKLIGDDHSSVSIPSSTSNTGGALSVDPTLSNSSHSNINASEPDYAALFERVGKRKNIVNTSSFIKTKGKVTKADSQQQQQPQSLSLRHSESDISSNPVDSFDNNSFENASVQIKEEPIDQIPSNELNGSSNEQINGAKSSSLANASKRILGSKLLKKKSMPATGPSSNSIGSFDSGLDDNKVSAEVHRDSSLDLETSYTNNSSFSNNYKSNTQEEIELGEKGGVEVKINLKELDLPPTTQIFPTSIINSKSKTRGRKENKEADMSDSSKIFLCSYCSRRFKRQEHLKRHFRSLHTFEKPYDCQICQKKFSRSDNLNQHLKIHKQEEEMAAQGLTLTGEPLPGLGNSAESDDEREMKEEGWNKIKEEEMT